MVCSVSMGALGSSAALRAAANTSLGLSHGLPTGLPNGMPNGMPVSQPQPSASQPGSARPASAAPTSADAPAQSQPIAKGNGRCPLTYEALQSSSDGMHCFALYILSINAARRPAPGSTVTAISAAVWAGNV